MAQSLPLPFRGPVEGDWDRPLADGEEDPGEERCLATGLCLAPLFISVAACGLASGSRGCLCAAVNVPVYRDLALAGAVLTVLFLFRVAFSAYLYGRRRSGLFWPFASSCLVAAILAVWGVTALSAIIRCGEQATA